MNLLAATAGAVGVVNPSLTATLYHSDGYATTASGKQVPAYRGPDTGRAQVQALTGKDLEHVNNLNLQGVFRAVYLFGNWSGVVRADRKGGDMLVFPQAPGEQPSYWLAVAVLESWADWTKVAAWLQLPPRLNIDFVLNVSELSSP